LGSRGAIAFTLWRNGNADIYALNQTDRQLLRLTYDPAEDRQPTWSPDGNYIAFASNRARNWDIYMLDLASGALIRLTRDPGFDANPSWSPDGRWIAFESYRRGNLDIYVMDTAGEEVRRVTTDSEPDFAPAWSPDSQALAFTSFRDRTKDVFVTFLERKEGLMNLTQSPDLDEDEPAWAPDGTYLTYVSGPPGSSAIQMAALDPANWAIDESRSQLFGAGTSPAWSPDQESLVYVYQRGAGSHLVAASLTGWAQFHEVYSTEGLLSDIAWSGEPLSARVIAQAQAAEPPPPPSLYIELMQPTPAAPPPYQLVPIPGLEASENVRLSDRVNESFNALRQRVIDDAGWDYLGTLASAWRPITYTPPSGHSRMSWQLCGRGIGLDQDPYEDEQPSVELLREDLNNVTYWRVMIRAAQQDGSMGEPLREAPWDLNARDDSGAAMVEGGAPKRAIPAGYYVDLTTLADAYGWERLPSLWRWRYFWPDIRWWEYQKTDGLNWWACMLEIYEPEEIEDAFGPIPGFDDTRGGADRDTER
jgi:TolB protein